MKQLVLSISILSIISCRYQNKEPVAAQNLAKSFQLDNAMNRMVLGRDSDLYAQDQWMIEYNRLRKIWAIHVRDISAGTDTESFLTGPLYLGRIESVFTDPNDKNKSHKKSQKLYGATFPGDEITFKDSLSAARWINHFLSAKVRLALNLVAEKRN